jgi:hypothetical protein
MSKNTQTSVPQPLFYKNPQPLLKDKHAKAGIAIEDNFAYAKDAKTLPINLPEFAEIAKYYPIVFTSSKNPVPIAVLGIGETNLYVDKVGGWEKGKYIPAYARRYPFAFTIPSSDPKQLLLCVDESSKRYIAKAKKDDARFFDDKGEQTEELKNILKFCEQYHVDNNTTIAFAKKLDDMDLLVERKISISLGAKTPSAELNGFKTLDEQKFAKLDEKTLAELHSQGLLGVLYYHLQSNSNWGNLVERHLKRAPKKPASKGKK